MDEKLIPPNLRQINDAYAQRLRAQRAEADGLEGEPRGSVPAARAKAKPAKPDQRWVRRGFAFRRIEEQNLIPGERLYGRKEGSSAFFRVGHVPRAENPV